MAIINDPSQNTWRIPWRLVIIFSFLAAGILGLGYYFYEYQVTILQNAKAEELSSIVDLKVKQIVTWRQQRLSDAQMIFDDRSFAHIIQNWFNGKGSLQQAKDVRQRLDELYRDSYVEVVLFDLQGRVRLSMYKVKPDHMSSTKKIAFEAMHRGKIILADLYFLHRSKEINMSLAIPILIHLIPSCSLTTINDPIEACGGGDQFSVVFQGD